MAKNVKFHDDVVEAFNELNSVYDFSQFAQKTVRDAIDEYKIKVRKNSVDLWDICEWKKVAIADANKTSNRHKTFVNPNEPCYKCDGQNKKCPTYNPPPTPDEMATEINIARDKAMGYKEWYI